MSETGSSFPRSSHRLLSLLDGVAERTQDGALLVGRILLSWIFVQSGWGKITNLQGFAAGLPKIGLPESSGYIGAPVEFAAGVAILIGLGTRYAAVALLVFTIVATLAVHAYWTYPAAQQAQQSVQFLKNLSIIGGLVLLFATGAGRASVDHMLGQSERA